MALIPELHSVERGHEIYRGRRDLFRVAHVDRWLVRGIFGADDAFV